MSGASQISVFTKAAYFFTGVGAVHVIAYRPFQAYYEKNNL